MSSVWNAMTGYLTCSDNAVSINSRTESNYEPPVLQTASNMNDETNQYRAPLNPPPAQRENKCETIKSELKLTHAPPRPMYKILLIGKRGVGKSELFSSYRNKTLHYTSCFMSVVIDNGEFHAHTLRDVYGDVVKIQLWDLMSIVPRFRPVSSSYVQNSSLIFLMFDVTDRATFDTLIHDIKVIDELKDRPLIALIATKIDRENRQVKTSDAVQLARKHMIPLYFEINTKNKERVLEMVNKCVTARHFMRKYNRNEYDVQKEFAESSLYAIYLPVELWQRRDNWSDIDVIVQEKPFSKEIR